MRLLAALVLALPCLAQSVELHPEGQFDLGSSLHLEKRVGPAHLVATDSGLIYTVMRSSAAGPGRAAFAVSDANGIVQLARPEIFFAQASVIDAVPSAGGRIWVAAVYDTNSNLPLRSESDIRIAPAQSLLPLNRRPMWLAVYDAGGQLLQNGLRLDSPETSQTLLGAENERVVFSGARSLHFEQFDGRKLAETAAIGRRIPQGLLSPGATIPVETATGSLVLVSKQTSDLLVADPATQTLSYIPVEKKFRAIAAAAAGNQLFVLTGDHVRGSDGGIAVIDPHGSVTAEYRFTAPASAAPLRLIAVRRGVIYISGDHGTGCRFSLPR